MLLTSFWENGMDILVGSTMIARLESSMVSYQRCLKMTDIPQECQTYDECAPSDWPSRGRVEFKQLNVKYRDNTDIVLKDLNFIIEPTQKVGIAGRTGAGKSTIVLALSRIIEANAGAILIDNFDISRISLKLLRDKITIIPQDPTLFEGTLRFNIDPHGVASDDEIIELLQQASLLSLIRRSEHGLDQHIDSRGTNLSSGEKQLIWICRAIIRNSKIIVMDEATANIDTKTENTIQTLVNNRFRDATVITIAHRLNTIINSDKILIIDDGMVAEYDSPKVLMKDKASLLSSLIKKVARD